MKIIKRNGSEVPFDITKIITAVTKASDSVSRKSSLTQEQISEKVGRSRPYVANMVRLLDLPDAV